jgi:hypothetical protein
MPRGVQRAARQARRILDAIAAHDVARRLAIAEAQQGCLVTGDELRERGRVLPNRCEGRLPPREGVQAAADAGEAGLGDAAG